MMVLAHTAAGAAIAHLAPSAGTGVALAFAAHLALDLPSHDDPTLRQEAAITVAATAATAVLFGVRRREFWGGVACALPDLEHVVPGLRERRRLYPSHRWGALHDVLPTPRASVGAQAIASIAALAFLAARVRAR